MKSGPMGIAVVGVDLAKNVSHLHAVDQGFYPSFTDSLKAT